LRFKDVSAHKLRGGYYTPYPVAEWLCRWAVRSPHDAVLDPSCGDGIFLRAAAGQLARLGASPESLARQVAGVEVVAEEAEKAASACREAIGRECRIFSDDFFAWLLAGPGASFDCVVGNPPFIRYQNFPPTARARAMALMERAGLRPNRLTNIWVPFVVGAVSCLKPNGRVAMVLPAELLQVSYAAQLRQYLADWFPRVTVFACNEMVFDNAQQEVVLLAAEGRLAHADPRNRCHVALVEAQSAAEVLGTQLSTDRNGEDGKFIQHDTEKWLQFFLDGREIEFLRLLRKSPKVATLRDHGTVDVGVVTGKNEFFVVSREEVEQYQLQDYVVPLVGRSAHLAGAVLQRTEHRRLGQVGNRVYLVHLSRHPADRFTPGLRRFIREGEQNGHQCGYKCRIRNPWYNVPAVWEPDCFLFRQIYDFPRVVLNKAGATSTDTIHRIRCSRPSARFAENLYTHLTAASAEIEGRSYGGGVLELEPTEAERLLVPKHLGAAMPIGEVDRLVRNGRLGDVLDNNDRAVLQEQLGLNRSECAMLKRVWVKMRDRRITRRRR
jgi:adenine-specific DNA methylase